MTRNYKKVDLLVRLITLFYANNSDMYCARIDLAKGVNVNLYTRTRDKVAGTATYEVTSWVKAKNKDFFVAKVLAIVELHLKDGANVYANVSPSSLKSCTGVTRNRMMKLLNVLGHTPISEYDTDKFKVDF